MHYFVKEPTKPLVEFIGRHEVEQAVNSGKIKKFWMVRGEEQSTWYPAGELAGLIPALPLVFNCSGCGGQIKSKRIDEGDRMTCPHCDKEIIIRNNRLEEATAQADNEVINYAKPVFIAGLVFVPVCIYILLTASPDTPRFILRYSIAGIFIFLGGIALYWRLIRVRKFRNKSKENPFDNRKFD